MYVPRRGVVPLSLSVLLLLGVGLVLHAPPRSALASSGEGPRAIVAAGEGTVPVAYQGVLYITVTSRAADGATAQADAARVEERVQAALKSLGVSEQAVTSGVARVVPLRSPEGELFAASRTLRVTVAKLAQAGAVVDAAVRAGASATSSVGWQPSPPTVEEERRAISLAVADAQRKGEAVAQALGVRLGPPAEILVNGSGWRTNPAGLPVWAVTVQVRYGF